MRTSEAPPAGWYPDPTGRAGLRWWNGLDWTDHRRAPVPRAHDADAAGAAPAPTDVTGRVQDAAARGQQAARSRTRDDTAEIMTEVRKVAREEVDRAVNLVTQRASDAARGFEPLISQYGDRVMRWVRNLGIIAIALIVLWLVLQTVAQTSLLDWLGDRIDNLTDGTIRVPVVELTDGLARRGG